MKIKAALTETINAFSGMPDDVKDLGRLAGELDAVRAANLEHHTELIAQAAKEGAKVVGLGELFPYPYFGLHTAPMWKQLAEDAQDGPSVRAMREAAAKHGVIVVAPIYEKDGEARYDTAVLIDERGAVLGKYRKTHIPKGVNDKGAFDELYYYAPGLAADPFPVFATSAGKIGVSICYDRHFPEVAQSLAAAGAEIVFSPAVTFGAKSERMWKHEFLVDACRWRLFIGGSNRNGVEKPWNEPFFGDSHWAGPDGERLPDLSEHPNLVIAELDLDQLRRPDPAGWDFARDRRPSIYRK